MNRNNQKSIQQHFRTGISALCVSVGAMIFVSCTPSAEQPPPDESPKHQLTEDSSAVKGEVPAEIINAIVDDLVEREGIERDSIEVTRAESVIWPDGALGCAKPGEMYTHAQVPGYWVVLRVNKHQYDYRASERGLFRRCNNAVRRQQPVG